MPTYNYSIPGIIGVTDANGATTEYKFTDDGSLLQITDPLNRVISYTYDANGNVSQITAPGNTITQFTYDAEDRLLTQTDPLNQTVSYSYSGNSESPTVVTDARGNPLTFTYDEQGNVTEIAYVDGSTESYVYDESGQVIQKTERSGDTFQYTYDQRGRLIQKTFDDGTFEEFTYDSRSNLISIKDVNGGVTTLTRDDEDRITKITYPNGKFLSYTYDAEGRRASMIDQDGFEVNYSYDSQDRLVGLTDDTGATLVAYEYDDVGNLVKETNGNGTFTTYDYDEAGQLTDIINYATEGVINSSFSYTYDDLGRVIAEVNSDGSWTYEYDATGQLTRAQFDSTNPDIADRDLQYVYDAEGNRVQTIINGETTNYTSNNLNQYSNVGDAEYTYDADGNLIEVIDGDDTYSYSYNDENRIIRTETPEGVWEYEYDALGNRTAVIQDGVRTEYLVDPFSSFGIRDVVFELDNVVGEYDQNGEFIANYAHGLGLVGRFDNESPAYFDADAIGSINGLTDDSGNYVNRYAYQPFGETLSSVESIDNQFEFVGQLGVMNDSSGLYFMRVRQYDPLTGRFTATDPLGLDGGSTNLYQYGLNNPLSFVDPEGELGVLAAFGIGVLAGLAANALYHQFSGDDKSSNKQQGNNNQYNNNNNTFIICGCTRPQQTDPLVLDLDGDGVELISLDQSRTLFDTNSNGFREYTSWVSADDGLLVLDANKDGLINDISELFGNSSTNGFDALATLDSNSDNVIDTNDTQFNDLRIWIDRNEDGITDLGELRTLAQWDIQSISLDRTDVNNSDSILSTGNFTFNDGSQSEIAAISLSVSLVNTVFNEPVELKAETQFLPNLRGFGQLPDLNIAMSLDPELLAQMRELVQLDDQDLEQVYAQVEDLFFKWAGVEDIDPNSRSEFFDARKHAFLEKFFQQPIEFEITHLAHTWGLLQSWADLTNAFTSRLAAQSFMRELFSESSYDVNSDSLETEASLSDLLEQIQNNLPEAFIDAARYWSYAIGVLDAHEDRFNLSESEYDNTLKTALGSDLSEYLPALRNPVFGNESNEGLWITPQEQSFLDGYSENDKLIGGLKEDILNGGAGSDDLNGDGGADYLHGGVGADYLYGESGNDTLDGGFDNDRLYGGFDDDSLHGGFDDDYLYGESGNDTLDGGDGNDTLDGGFDNDRLYGGFGNDSLSGGDGDDYLDDEDGDNILFGGDGNDTLDGGFDNDHLYGGYDDDSLHGGDGDDYLYGESGNDTLDGGDGNDDLFGGLGNDALYGESGNDSIHGESGNNILDGGDGDDDLFGEDGNDTLDGGDGNDDLFGWNGDDYLMGDDGNDSLSGSNGADSLLGGLGDDSLLGGFDDDSLSGGNGNDYLSGGDGDDWLIGGNGNDSISHWLGHQTLDDEDDQEDTLDGGDGNDYLFCGDGNDYLFGGLGNDNLFGGLGNDNLYGESGDDYLDGEEGNDSLHGGDGDDRLFGDEGNDSLHGGDGDDSLFGGWNGDNYLMGDDGNDSLSGSNGADSLLGGLGDDSLSGGHGHDRFVFNGSHEGIDTISDFESSSDLLDVSASGFGGDLSANAFLEDFRFVLGNTALDSDDRFIYNNTTGDLFFDSDGTGNATQQQLARLSGNPNLSANNIWIT